MSREPDWATADGRVKLYCGDCLDILPTLGKVDCCVTDPPYGMNALDGSRTVSRYGQSRKNNWDTSPPTENAMNSILSSAEVAIVWGLNYFAPFLPPHKKFLVWNKPHVAHLETRSSAEIAFTNIDGPADAISMRSDQDPVHPTQKPVALMEWCVGMTKGETVLDPYMGSGTTGVACVRLGRKFIGIEKEPRYFEIAVKRIKAELERAPLFEAKPTYITRPLFGSP